MQVFQGVVSKGSNVTVSPVTEEELFCCISNRGKIGSGKPWVTFFGLHFFSGVSSFAQRMSISYSGKRKLESESVASGKGSEKY